MSSIGSGANTKLNTLIQSPSVESTAQGVGDVAATSTAGIIAEAKAKAQSQVEASDAYGPAAKADGLKNITDGKTEIDDQLIEVFAKVGVPSPYNGNTTNTQAAALSKNPEFNALTAEVSASLNSGKISDNPELAAKIVNFAKSRPNVMEALYLVFRESIKENNEDRKYFLLKLQDFNKIAEGLTDYLHTLVDKSTEVNAKIKPALEDDSGAAQKVTVDVEVKTFDTGSLGPDGNIVVTSSQTKPLVKGDIDNQIKLLEAAQEEVRNKRQQATTSFQNFDQKGNQLMNLLTTVVKTMNEMRSIGPASRSGM